MENNLNAHTMIIIILKFCFGIINKKGEYESAIIAPTFTSTEVNISRIQSFVNVAGFLRLNFPYRGYYRKKYGHFGFFLKRQTFNGTYLSLN